MSDPQQWQPTNPPTPPVQQRGWFARNRVLAIVLGILLVVVLCCCGGGVLALSGDSGSGSDASGSEARVGIGTPARDGKFEFTVTEVEKDVSEVGSEYLKETADGQFVLVHITVRNIGDEAQTLVDSEQELTDADGRSFTADSSASISLEDNDVWMNEINPGNTVKGTLVYDMPSDAEPAEITLHDSMFSDGVTVSLE